MSRPFTSDEEIRRQQEAYDAAREDTKRVLTQGGIGTKGLNFRKPRAT